MEGGYKVRPSMQEEMQVWARQSRVDSDWIRIQAPGVGLDPSKMALGHVLRIILGDDRNSFTQVHDLIIDEESTRANQSAAIERLDWEIEVPEIPQELREQLIVLKQHFVDSDWSSKIKYIIAKNRWFEMQNGLEVSLEQKPELKAALEYYDDNSQIIPPKSRPQRELI